METQKKENTKVLIIEDNIADAELVKSMLKTPGSEFIISNADRLSSATPLLDAEQFNSVLLDLNLPDSMGLDTLKKIREKASHSAIIVLGGSMTKKQA